MAVFPTPYTVEILPYDDDGTDAYGNPQRGYGEPVDQPVYGWWAPNPDDAAFSVMEDALTRGLQVGVPPEFECDPRDRVRVDGVEYSIVGNTQDYTHGPFGWNPGGVLPLQRVEVLR